MSFEDFEKLDFRVAEILSASKVEGAKKLLKLKISLGNETRQVIAGIAEAYSQEELVGKKIAVLTNLEPKNIHGERSEAMLLAAVHNNKPILLIPDKDTPPGSPIS
ncbi:methionine--tRNA ligase subunit beta [candidate division WOR-3 bacterium]|nr:methionine--tRNA ligase subunit beta [candidate division WOR-3 bacterium]